MYLHAMFDCCMFIVSSPKVSIMLFMHCCLYKVHTLMPCVFSTVTPIDACNILLESLSCLLSLHVLHGHVCILDHIVIQLQSCYVAVFCQPCLNFIKSITLLCHVARLISFDP